MNVVLDEGPFKGLNIGAETDRLEVGELQSADNAVIDGGDIYTRPGYRGQLSALLGGGAIYGFTPFISSGSSWALFVSGGKLYKWQYGATSATELLEGGSSLSLTTASTQTATAPSLVYLVDGTGSLHRVDLTSSVAMTSLSTPSAPSAAIATGQTLEATSTASDWHDDRAGGGGVARGWLPPDNTNNLLANTSFDSSLASTDWVAIAGGARDATAGYPHSGAGALKLSLAGDGAYQKLSDGSTDVPTLTTSSLLNFTGTPQRARTFKVSFWMRSGDSTGEATVEVEVLAYTSTSVAASVRYTASQAYQATTSQYNQHTFIASFNDLDTDPDDIELRFVAGLANTAAVWVDDVDLRAVSMTLTPTLSSTSDQISALTYAAITGTAGGRAPGVPSPDSAAAGYSHRQYVFRTFGTAQDWRAYPVLSARVTFPGAVLSANPDISLRLGFATSSSAAIYTAPGVWSEDGKSLVWTLDGIPTATLQALKYLIVEVVGNQVGGVGANQLLFRFGPIRSVGALSVGAPVWYRLVEIDGSGDATLLDVPESDVSRATIQTSPTSDARMVQLAIPARTNSSATHFALYRYGGSLIDPERGKYPLGFLVGILSWSQATFDFGSGPAAGTGTLPRAPANPYLKWTLTSSNNGGTLIDNTPDGWLGNGQVAMEGREPASSISAPRHVAVWDGRVWLTSGSAELYASWRTSTDRRAGLYFAKVYQPGPTDVHAALRGWWVKLGLDSGDQIQAVLPLRDAADGALAVFTTQGLWMVSPAETGYGVDRITGAPGVVGSRAACVAHGALWWLSPDGLWRMTGGAPQRVSGPIQSALPPESGLTPSALALSSIVAWWRYLLVILPGSTSDTYPTVAFVWDTEEQAWTRWTEATWTGGAALQSAGSLGRLIVTSRDGQIFAIGTEEGDKALSGSTVAGVALSVRTRTSRGRHQQTPEEASYDVKTGGALTATVTVKGDVSGADSAVTQSLASGDNAAWFRPSRGAYGRGLSVQFDATATTRTRVRRLTLQASEGTM